MQTLNRQTSPKLAKRAAIAVIQTNYTNNLFESSMEFYELRFRYIWGTPLSVRLFLLLNQKVTPHLPGWTESNSSLPCSDLLQRSYEAFIKAMCSIWSQTLLFSVALGRVLRLGWGIQLGDHHTATTRQQQKATALTGSTTQAKNSWMASHCPDFHPGNI